MDSRILDKIEALAKNVESYAPEYALSPNKEIDCWHVRDEKDKVSINCLYGKGKALSGDYAECANLARYIAVASPKNVLMLVNKVRILEKAVHYLAGRYLQTSYAGAWGLTKVSHKEIIDNLKAVKKEAIEAAKNNKKGFTFFQDGDL